MSKYPQDWEKWLPEISQKIDRLALYEKQMHDRIQEMHDVLYKNGLTSKINTLWEWHISINKILVALILAILIGIGSFVWQMVNGMVYARKQMEMIERKLEHLEQYEKR